MCSVFFCTNMVDNVTSNEGAVWNQCGLMQVTKQQLEEKEVQIAELKALCEQQKVDV